MTKRVHFAKQTQFQCEEWHYSTFLQIFLMCGLTKDGLILQFASALKLLPYVVLVEVYE